MLVVICPLTSTDVTTVALIPGRFGTAWWRDYVHPASEILEIPGRIKFVGAEHTAPFPSVLAIYRPAVVLNGGPCRRWVAGLA